MIGIQPFIMCGGSGTRLWPVSRATMPKQFQAFVGNRTLLQETALRVSGKEFAPPAFIAAESHRFFLEDQIGALGIGHGPIVLEPVSRNTAPVALVASILAKRDGMKLVLLLPSDHVIKDAASFRAAVLVAAPSALAGRICLFGVPPTRAETGYGYIEVAEGDPSGLESAIRPVSRFVEKPTREEAQKMLASGRYVWNAGIFLFSPEAMLAEAAEQRPDLLELTEEAVRKANCQGDVVHLDQRAYASLEPISIDYAFMEASNRTSVSRLDLDWNDLGAWDAIYSANLPDNEGNVVSGRAIVLKTTNSYVRSDKRLVATLGLSGMVVIVNDDAVLVADKSHTQDVKAVLENLRGQGFAEADSHAEVHRPWGSYHSVVCGDRFQVKKITVKPGGRLSLQLHRHRAEHWIIVRGTARITCGERVFMLYENQSTYIPQGDIHRIENPGHIALEMIEVQSGSYLGEDDIVRVEDIYGRAVAAE